MAEWQFLDTQYMLPVGSGSRDTWPFEPNAEQPFFGGTAGDADSFAGTGIALDDDTVYENIPGVIMFKDGETTKTIEFAQEGVQAVPAFGFAGQVVPRADFFFDRLPPAPKASDPRYTNPNYLNRGPWNTLTKDSSGYRHYVGGYPFNDLGGSAWQCAIDKISGPEAPGGFGASTQSYFRAYAYIPTDSGIIESETANPNIFHFDGINYYPPRYYPVLIGSDVPGDTTDFDIVSCSIANTIPHCCMTSIDYTPVQANMRPFMFVETFSTSPPPSMAMPTYNANQMKQIPLPFGASSLEQEINALLSPTDLQVYPSAMLDLSLLNGEILGEPGQPAPTPAQILASGAPLIGPGGVPCSISPFSAFFGSEGDPTNSAAQTIADDMPYSQIVATLNIANPVAALGFNGFQKSHAPIGMIYGSAAYNVYVYTPDHSGPIPYPYATYNDFLAAVKPYASVVRRAIPCYLYVAVLPEIYIPAGYYYLNQNNSTYPGSGGPGPNGYVTTLCAGIPADAPNQIGTSFNTKTPIGPHLLATGLFTDINTGLGIDLTQALIDTGGNIGWPTGTSVWGRIQNFDDWHLTLDTGWVNLGTPVFETYETTANAGYAYSTPFWVGIDGPVEPPKGRNVATLVHPITGWFGKAIGATDDSQITFQRTNGPYTAAASMGDPVTIVSANSGELVVSPALGMYVGAPGDQIVCLFQQTETDSSNNVYRTWSSDDGATWSTPVMAFPGGTQPIIAIGSTGERIECVFVPSSAGDGTGAISATIRNLGDLNPSSPINLQYWNGSANVDLSVQDSGFDLKKLHELQGRWVLTCTMAGDDSTTDLYSADEQQMAATTQAPMTFTPFA